MERGTWKWEGSYRLLPVLLFVFSRYTSLQMLPRPLGCPKFRPHVDLSWQRSNGTVPVPGNHWPLEGNVVTVKDFRSLVSQDVSGDKPTQMLLWGRAVLLQLIFTFFTECLRKQSKCQLKHKGKP